jgi:hypothetical protein
MIVDCMSEVERRFAEAPDRFETVRKCPVTGSSYWYLDPIDDVKLGAFIALRARAWFEKTGPRDAPPLPLCKRDREDLMSVGGLSSLVSLFARSLRAWDFAFDNHPSFYDFSCGVLASFEEDASHIRDQDPELVTLYPPRRLPGLNDLHIWAPERS